MGFLWQNPVLVEAVGMLNPPHFNSAMMSNVNWILGFCPSMSPRSKDFSRALTSRKVFVLGVLFSASTRFFLFRIVNMWKMYHQSDVTCQSSSFIFVLDQLLPHDKLMTNWLEVSTRHSGSCFGLHICRSTGVDLHGKGWTCIPCSIR